MLWITVILCIVLLLILARHYGLELFDRYANVRWRLGIWGVSLKMMRDKLFFGHGINTFMRVFQAYRGNNLGPTYAHNCFIQLAAETGAIGLFSFLWIIVRMLHCSLKNMKNIFEYDQNFGVLAIGLLSGIFAFLVHSFFDTHLYSLQLSVYLWFLIGMLLTVHKISKIPAI
jgi:O-antigen ligase